MTKNQRRTVKLMEIKPIGTNDDKQFLKISVYKSLYEAWIQGGEWIFTAEVIAGEQTFYVKWGQPCALLEENSPNPDAKCFTVALIALLKEIESKLK